MSEDIKKAIAGHVLRKVLEAKHIPVTAPRTHRRRAFVQLAQRARKKRMEVKLQRKLAVIVTDNNRINELFQLWLQLRTTKESFAKFVSRRLKMEHCT